MADPCETRKRRGPYLQFLSDPVRKIPKSTLYHWKKKKGAVGRSKTGKQEELCDSELEETIRSPTHMHGQQANVCFSDLEAAIKQPEGPVQFSDAEISSDEDGIEQYESQMQGLEVNNLNNEDDFGQSTEFEGGVQERCKEEDDIERFTGQNSSGFTDNPLDEDTQNDVLIDDLYDLDSEEEEAGLGDGENPAEELSFFTSTADEERKPLYQGAPITLGASLLLVMTFVVRHGLSGLALTDLLVLIELHCVAPNLCKTSMKLLREFFKKIRCPVELHYYCTFCQHYIGTVTASFCPNKHCLKDFPKNSSYFIIIPLATQLCSLLSRAEMPKLLQYRIDRKKKKKENIEDVFDGKLYRKHFNERGFFHGTSDDHMQDELHISLQVNTDGVAIFRSSKFSLWPIYFTVNELPPDARFSRKNKIFAGLWFGTSKPMFRTFLEPFGSTLKEIFEKGSLVKLSTGETKTVKCILLSGTFDAPAKCLFHNIVQFNGYFGCPYCLHPGTTLKTTSTGAGHSHVYSYDRENNGQTRQRNHEETVCLAIKAERLRKQGKSNTEATKGVKGLSWSMYFPKFNVISGTAIDYMHSVLLGVVKMLLTLWTDKSYNSEPWFLGADKIKIFEKRFLSIRPPYRITRTPRSIIANMAHLKASELRSFLLFYGLPCLWGLLPNDYFQHFLLLVDAIFLLLQDSISSDELSKSACLLNHFCLKVESLYGRRYETFNVHCLLHLVSCVENLGPLWASSCFCYEDYNGDLRKLFHGTQNVEFQISFAICFQQKIPELIPLLEFRSSQHEFYNHLVSTRPQLLDNKKERISTDSYVVGAQTLTTLDGDKRRALLAAVGEVERVFVFKRLVHQGTMIHSQDYKVVTRRNSYTVSFHGVAKSIDLRYGWVVNFIKCFVKCKNTVFCNSACLCKTPKYLALIYELKAAGNIKLSADRYTNATASHIIPFQKESGKIVGVQIENLNSLCLTVDCGMDVLFVCNFPNAFEKD